MKKILWVILALILTVCTGCKNTVGTPADTEEYTVAVMKNTYQNGSDPVQVAAALTTAGNISSVTFTFNVAYDRNSVTAANGAIQVHNFILASTQSTPAGTLGAPKTLTIDYTSDTELIASFDNTSDTADGYLIYLDATKVTFLNGYYKLNGNGNQSGGEPTDSYLNSAISFRTLAVQTSFAPSGKASVTSAGTMPEDFIVGSRSMVISGALNYLPNGIGAIELQRFDYATAVWQNVGAAMDVVTVFNASTPNQYFVVAKNFAPAKEKDLYRVYIPQPSAITYAVPGEGPGTGTAVGLGLPGGAAYISANTVSPTATRTAYAALSTITNNQLTFSVINFEVDNAYLKVSATGTSVIEHAALVAVQSELMQGCASGKIKLFSPSGNAQNSAYQLTDTVGTKVTLSESSSYTLYKIGNLKYGTNGAVGGTPLMYAENSFVLKSRGLLTGATYEAELHPVSTPDPRITPFMKNWTQILP